MYRTIWSFDIVNIEGEYLATRNICIGFPSESMAYIVESIGIQLYPDKLRTVMFELAREEFDGYPDFRLKFVKYSDAIEVDYIAEASLCLAPDTDDYDILTDDEDEDSDTEII
jgi:hypothetical protein